MTNTMWVATLAWVLLLAGLYFRKARSRHVPLVISSIILDLGIVIYLQITRDAVQTTIAFTPSTLQMIHIAFSLAAVVLYMLTVVLYESNFGVLNTP